MIARIRRSLGRAIYEPVGLRTWWVFDRPAWIEAWQVRLVHRLPYWVVYHCLIRAWVNATRGPWSGQAAPTVTMHEAIQRWESTRGDDKVTRGH